MARNNWEGDYSNSSMGIFSGVLAGALIGAAAVFLSDDRNRRRIQRTVDDWKEKGEERINDIQEKADDLKQKGLQKVSKELEKTQSKVNRQRHSNGRMIA